MAAYVTFAMLPWRSLRSQASAATFVFCALVGCGDRGESTNSLPDANAGSTIPGISDGGADCSPQRPDAALPAFVPPHEPRSVCTAAQIKAYYDACWVFTGDAGSQCADFVGDPANSPCINCVLTPAAATKYGAIFTYPDGTTPNTSGCIALVDGDTSTVVVHATKRWASARSSRARLAASIRTPTVFLQRLTAPHVGRSRSQPHVRWRTNTPDAFSRTGSRPSGASR
jgi:hypothetical protein